MNHFENKNAGYFENDRSVYTCGVNNDDQPNPETGRRTMTHLWNLQKTCFPKPDTYVLCCQELTTGNVIVREESADRAPLAEKLDTLIATGERFHS